MGPVHRTTLQMTLQIQLRLPDFQRRANERYWWRECRTISLEGVVASQLVTEISEMA